MKLIISSLFLLIFATLTFAHENRTREAIFEEYFLAGSALANDSLKDVADAAQRLEHFASEAKHEMKDYQEEFQVVSSEAAKISASKNLESARTAYSRISETLIPLKAALKIKADKYYCPMLKKTWLQKDPKIQNPYMGKSMASCGEKKTRAS